MSIFPNIFGCRTNVFDPFSLDVWDPFDGFPFSSNVPSLPSSSRPRSEISSFVGAQIDWKDTPAAHVFKADLPGLEKEEVKVEVEDGRVLQISGERRHEQEEKTDTWHCVERPCGKFLRQFRLLENAKVEGVKAAMENGVRTVSIPKEEVTSHPRSKYEDVYINNHTTVWGSWWKDNRWGYKCYKQIIRNSYCTGSAGIEAVEATADLMKANMARN